ncbi:acyl transferase/acyl hydrolase/lysophospholipase [Apiospora marii]|uniref:Acyl transferase/acyl hydrolase/lysophospholipase n=1 Tax=Apiospora marii TaxID=335849 RepID=A0ABR1R6M5_9PEZI
MSSNAPSAHPRDQSILSLDGGGIRGLSSLQILKQLMEQVNYERDDMGLQPVKPCDIFDLIVGTSTGGGIIAIMLGRLQMDVSECIEVYEKLAKQVFGKQISAWRQLSDAVAKREIKAKFDSEQLKTEILDIISQRFPGEDPQDIPLENSDGNVKCKVPGQITTSTIVQAALATSAATGYFDPVTIQQETFIDGAMRANNPVQETLDEIQAILKLSMTDAAVESCVKCVVSIGTGHPGLLEISGDPFKVLQKSLVAIVTETEGTAEKFSLRHESLMDGGRYFRFNVTHGLEAVGLEEWNKTPHVTAVTREYLRKQKRPFASCVRSLTDQEGRST